eukprot:scaffold670272_cov45-Prasinocladus_malaysianus.AAC.1
MLAACGPPCFAAIFGINQQRLCSHELRVQAQGEVRELQEDGAVTLTPRWEADESALLRQLADEQASLEDADEDATFERPAQNAMFTLAEMNDVTEADFGRQIDDDAI